VQNESQLQEDATNLLGAGSAGTQANGKFEASFKAVQKATFGSLGCRPRAQSVHHCLCVLTLRQTPVTGAVQDESQLQEDASKLGAGSAGTQANGRFGASF